MVCSADCKIVPIYYQVRNVRTGEVHTFKTRTGAAKGADRIDNAYGACITTTQAFWS